MRSILAAIRIGLIDMRGDLRRFGLLVICLAVGTALIAGVSSVGTSIRQAVERDAAVLMGGDVELSRTDRAATGEEFIQFQRFGRVASAIDTNVRAELDDKDAFVDLIAVGPNYPLLGRVSSPDLPTEGKVFETLGYRDGMFGALVGPIMLGQLGIAVGDTFTLGGTSFEVRGMLAGIPDSAVRGFRLGLPTLISTEGFAVLGDRTSPLPGLGTFFRYKLVLTERDVEAGKAALQAEFGADGWTVRSARDGLGPMVRYYDLFMRFLVIVGLASLLIGGVSVWTSISAYIAERSAVIAVLRSMGATRTRVFLHFFAQVGALAAVGVGIGLAIGASVALIAIPVVGRAVGVNLAPQLHLQPLLVAAGVGLVTAFAFAYLPLQQAQSIRPVTLFRAKGLAAPPIDWGALFASFQFVPLLLAGAAFIALAILMTGDVTLVLAFVAVSALSATLFRLAIAGARALLKRAPETRNRPLRYALRNISGEGSNAPSVVVSVALALTMLVVVLVLEVNLRNEYLGASVFDAPSFVASDLFEDEVETLQAMKDEGGDIRAFTATPMLRGEFAAVNDRPAAQLSPQGPEALFLLSGEVPVTYRSILPATSRVIEGKWWAADHTGAPLVSLHESLKAGLGINIGDRVSFSIFGDTVTAEVANFRDYSWQGGIDFLATFSPGVLESYPSTLLAAVTAIDGRERAVEQRLAETLPDVRFIAIGETLNLITAALGQLSLASSLVGGLAVGNGLLVLIGALTTGRRQRQSDAVITKVLGATQPEIVWVSILQYVILAAFAALIATPVGIGLAFILTGVLLDVEFVVNPATLAVVGIGAVLLTGLLGAATIWRALATRPAHLLREP
jgi:putative ABC transport system permease protein